MNKWHYLGLLTLAGGVVALIYAVVQALGGSPWGIVAFILLLTGVMLADRLVSLYFRVVDNVETLSERRAARLQVRGEVIDAPYQVTAQPPPAALPAPITVTAMRFSEHGVTRPMGAPPARPPVQVETVADSGEKLTVPLIRLQRFLSLPTPSRTEWIGDRKLYSDCASFCLTHGLLTQDKRGGYKWRDEYDRESRRAWALQFDPSPTEPVRREIGAQPVNADE